MELTIQAFVCPRPLIWSSRAPHQPTRYISMKGKNASKGKRVAKGKRRATISAGSSQQPKEKLKETALPSEREGDGVQLQAASGESGDTTPHKASVASPTYDEMPNPQKTDPLDAPTEPLVDLPNLSANQRKDFRFDIRSKPDEVIEMFEDARQRGELAPVIAANRDLVTENLLYRFTSAILQIESRAPSAEHDEESRNMRSLRKDLIAHCWSFDFPVKVAIQQAEVRLLKVLKGSDISKDIYKHCGRTPLDVDAFWIVIFAAVAAWEERGQENPELVDVDMQTSLTAAAEACRTLDAVKERISPHLRAVQGVLGSSDPSAQATVVEELDEDTIAALGCCTEQIRLLPTPAYGALVQRLRSIMNYIMSTRYAVSAPVLEPFRFNVPEVERESRLVSFSKSSESIKRQR